MLGTMKSLPNWKWAAFGKHPVAGDFFKAGPDDPFFQAFSGWVENGYRMMGDTRKNSQTLYSWRFWAKGVQKNGLVCGVARDSFDTIGRPYPFIMIGTGLLPEWQQNWDLLPLACEVVWDHMEYLITKRYIDLSQLEDEVRRLPSPKSDWSAFLTERLNRSGKGSMVQSVFQEETTHAFSSQMSAPELMIPFDTHAGRDASTFAAIRCSQLKGEEKNAPNAAFIGGLIEKTFMAVFRRPLAAQDFIRLWSVGGEASVPNSI